MTKEYEPFIAAYTVLKILQEEGCPPGYAYVALDIEGACTLNLYTKQVYDKYKTLAESLMQSKDWYPSGAYYVLKSDDGLKTPKDKVN